MRYALVVWGVLVGVGGVAEAGWRPRPQQPVLAPRELVPAGEAARLVGRLAVASPPRPWLAGGGVAVHGASGEVFVAETDGGAVVVVAPDGSSIRRTIVVGGGPEQVVVAPDGRAFVTLRERGELAAIAPGAATATTVAVDDEPFGLALDAERGLLFVSLAGEAAVVALDATSLQPRFRVAVDAEPRALALVPDRRKLFVSHLTGRALSMVQLDERGRDAVTAVHSLPLAMPLPSSTSRLSSPASTSRVANLTIALALSPDARAVYAPHVLADTGHDEPGREGDCRGGSGYGGGIGEPLVATVAIIDTGSEALVGRWPRWIPDRCAHGRTFDVFSQPRAIVADPTRNRFFVAAFGSSRVRELAVDGEQPRLVGEIVLPPGSGPRGLALSADGDRLYVQTAFDHALTVLDVSVAARVRRRPPVLARAVVGTDAMPPGAAAGRRLFFSAHDPRISRRGQFACASCHPEGRSDGMVWQVEEGPRRTPVLADRLVDTAPYDWEGRHATLEQHIRNTVGVRLEGRGLTNGDLENLVAYLTGHCRLPSRATRPLSPRAERGRALFASDEVGCAHCHDPARGLRDGRRHDVGTTSEADRASRLAMAVQRVSEHGPSGVDGGLARAFLRSELDAEGPFGRPASPGSPTADQWFRAVARAWDEELRGTIHAAQTQRIAYDTPSLIGIGRSAGPFLHDGSAPSLRALVTTLNACDRMGRTSDLSPADVDALVAYLETL